MDSKEVRYDLRFHWNGAQKRRAFKSTDGVTNLKRISEFVLKIFKKHN